MGIKAAQGHEIPSRVTVRAFIRPDGHRLFLIVRVPLEAMRDLEFPLRPGGMLDIAMADSTVRQAAFLWIGDYVRIFEADTAIGIGRLLGARVSSPTDRAFTSAAEAMAHVLQAAPDRSLELPWQQAMLDAVFEYSINSDRSRFSIEPAWAHLGITTRTVLAFAPVGGAERVYQYWGDPGVVRLDPRWHQAAARFVRLGVEHILGGIDHLLFLLCLVLPIRRVRTLIPVVTAFTVAHSITLIAAASGLTPDGLWFPPFIEVVIAASVVLLAVENALGARPGRRWKLAFAFGLVHGFGLSFALRDSLQFAGRHLVSSLLAFNVGVELGQLALIAIAVPLIGYLFRRAKAERPLTIVISLLVGHTAWHWMAVRWDVLRQYEVGWQQAQVGLVSILLWTMLAVIVGGAAWAISLGVGWLSRQRNTTEGHMFYYEPIPGGADE